MPSFPLHRLRRWLAVAAILFSLVVAGIYFYARTRQQSVLKRVPSKIGYDIKQTATGFQFSKSEGGRTLFTVHARDLKEFKLNGRAELRHVSILLYGRSSLRFDQIYGDDFTYDERSGDIVAIGEVQMDLQANPSGLTDSDQAAPKELKNPIHIKTSDLVFNQQTGNASTNARADFRLPQATGWAVGVQYASKTNTLTMASQVHVTVSGANACEIQAVHGVVTGEPRQILLDHPRLERGGGTLWADGATLYLAPDNSVERILARGNVNAEKEVEAKQRSSGPSNGASNNSSAAEMSLANQNQTVGQGQSAAEQTGEMRARSDEGELFLTGKQNQLQTGILTGHVQVERIGFQPMQGTAGRAVLDFGSQNQVQKVHASEGVRLAQQAVSKEAVKGERSGPQDFEVTAPIIDFFVLDGQRLDRAVTSGAAQIMIYPHQDSLPSGRQGLPPQRTVIQAGKFNAKFDPTANGGSRLSEIHGAPNAKITSVTPDEPDRISASEKADAVFLPLGGIESVTQQGHVAYTDGQPPEKRTQAWSDKAHYTPADQVLTMVGNPRVINGGMETTANTIRINRQTNEAHAEDNVKSTYSEVKEQPNGALLASSSPIHVTSRSMTARNNPNVALYTGDARLWQDANVIEAPSIQFDRENRFVTAQGTPAQSVSTLLEQRSRPADGTSYGKGVPKPGSRNQSGPVAITSSHLTYSDPDRKAHYEGGVVAKGTDFTASAREMDAYLLPRSETASSQSAIGSGQLDHMVGQGNVVIQQPTRRADGQNLIYTAADDKFVLTGGPPSIFDAERGRTTGVSLTFFRRDDRVLVEGEASSPVVTQTRVAR
jgi:lipopolysaccharide export system protein LptA